MVVDSEILFWPISRASSSKKCFIVGWEDASGIDSGLEIGNGTLTTVCAFTVDVVTNDGHKRSGTPLDDLRQALNELSDRQPCFRQGSCESQWCWPCTKYGSLKVLGTWEPVPVSPVENDGDLRKFISTPNGPWEKPKSHNGEKVNCHQQLVMYESCGGIQSLKHYCHRVKRSSEFDPGCMDPFQKVLARISEAESIEEELKCIIQLNSARRQEKPTGEEVLHASYQRQKRTNADKQPTQSRNPRTLTPCLSVHNLLIAWSLSFLHWNGQSSTNTIPFLRHFPLLRAFYLFRWQRKQGLCCDETKLPRIAHIRSSTNTLYSAIQATFDGILGLIVGTAVASNTTAVRSSIIATWELIHQRLLRNNIGWLETFPVGFKLNVPLTRNMGREILIVVEAYEWSTRALMASPARQKIAISVIGVVGVAFGFVMLSAVLFDLVRLASMHICVISLVFSKMYKAQLRTLSSLWKLFRGKKQNVLRSRTDTLEYDSMQLLLGTVLFTICLFLFTTILVYYTFFTVVNLCVTVFVASAWLMFVAVQSVPLGKLFSQTTNPMMTSEMVVFETLSEFEEDTLFKAIRLDISGVSQAEGRTCVRKLVSVPQSISSILSEAYSSHLKSFIFRVFSYFVSIPSGCSSSLARECLTDGRAFYEEQMKAAEPVPVS